MLTLPNFPAQKADARIVLASPPLPIAPSNHGKFYNLQWCAHDPGDIDSKDPDYASWGHDADWLRKNKIF